MNIYSDIECSRTLELVDLIFETLAFRAATVGAIVCGVLLVRRYTILDSICDTLHFSAIRTPALLGFGGVVASFPSRKLLVLTHPCLDVGLRRPVAPDTSIEGRNIPIAAEPHFEFATMSNALAGRLVHDARAKAYAAQTKSIFLEHALAVVDAGHTGEGRIF